MMSRVEVKKSRLVAQILILFIVLLKWNFLFAAAGELDIDFNYPSRFVPPLTLKEFPEGISSHIENSYPLILPRNNRIRLVEIFQNYVFISIYKGDNRLYNPQPVEFNQYVKYSAQKKLTELWVQSMADFSGTKGQGDKSGGVEVKLDFVKMPKPVKSIIGEGGPRITVTGSRRISFSGRSEWDDDLVNTGTFKQSKFPSLHMEQTSRFKIRGEIGSKIHIEVDQDSNRDVDLANTLKLRYKGEDDEIIQTIEAGNTNLSLPNSQFIGYSQNIQGLFGIKATAQLGKMQLTMITSQEKGSSEKSSFRSGTKPEERQIWDYQFLRNVYFNLGKPTVDFTSSDSLIEVKLFIRGTERDLYGVACVDPVFDSTSSDSTGGMDTLSYISSEEDLRGEFERGYFALLDETMYDVYLKSRYVVLRTNIDNNTGVLAAYIKYAHINPDSSIEIRQEGNITADTLVLKLIRDPDVDTSFSTWDLEWKNVYNLGARDLTPEGFELQIYQGTGNIETDSLDQGGTPYIELFGFDEINNSDNTPVPDGIFDFDVQHDIDASRGHLIFHQTLPFLASFLNTKNQEIYTLQSNQAQYKKYYIQVKTAKRDNTFSLGRTNIIEGSEVVKTSDGRILKRGTDYTIIYEIGQISFISDEAVNLASDITVDYDYSPFFMAEKKTLFGLSAKYEINDKSSISFAGMYRKESTREFRPRVGREPRRAMIWDSNFIFHFNPGFMTSAVDALPFIETDAQSMIEISGEVAQSFPNPNLRHDAYIDDFEGTKEYTDLIMRRGIWTVASIPLDWDNNEWLHSNRRKLWWYNPYTPFTITSIWPERADFREHENRHDVLILEYFPDTTNSMPDTAGWAGIIRPMYAGLSDQSRTKFIEIWYLPDDTVSAGDGMLYIDAGKISEDVNDDGEWEKEDANTNGVFDEDEDTGLDGMTDAEERIHYNSTEDDPAGDNWYYSSDSDERDDYSRINGTEGNRNDPDRMNRLDTEDINNNKSLDRTNSYFQYSISLKNPEYIKETTGTGWKLLRIPFQDPSVYRVFGSPDFSNINFIRLWIAGASGHHKLHFASVQLVGNKWQEMAIPDSVYIHGMPMDTKFEVTVKNSQEHASTYYSPPGIQGEYDRDLGIQEKEQSLVLRYENLYPGQTVKAYWSLLATEDYTFYNKMKMFVHGDENLSETIPLYFFFRVGLDSLNNYYEYKVRLTPGWAEDNHVELDFSKITALKSYYHTNNPDSISQTDTSYVSFTDRDNYPFEYRVVGNPSLSQVKMFIVGLEYDTLTADSLPVPLVPIDGEAWCDELLVTEVRKKSDFASRISSSFSFADLMNVTAKYSRTGADFFPLSAKKPSGALTTQQSVTSRINVNKFFPPSWGISLPVSLSWQKSLQLPRLKTGSDIILPDDQRQEEKTENRQWSVSASERFTKSTKNWLMNLTLHRIDTRVTYSRKYGTSPVTPISRNSSYEVSAKYDLSPKKKPFVKPFIWTKSLYLPSSIQEIKFFFLPTALIFDSKVNSTKSFTRSRRTESSSYVRDLSINQTYKMDIFSALSTSFTTNTTRDISDPNTVNLTFDPRKIKLGRERTYNQTFTVSFSPVFSRHLKPRFRFDGKYNENSDLIRNPDSTRTTQLGANLRGDMTFDLKQLPVIGKFFRQQGSESDQRQREYGEEMKDKPKDKNGSDKKEDEEKEKHKDELEKEEQGEGEEDLLEEGKTDKKKIPNPLVFLKKTLYVFGTIKPLQGSITTDKKLNRAGLYDRPSWMYTLGFADNPKVRRKETIGSTSADQRTTTRDYSLRTGLKPLKNLDISTSYKNRISYSRSSNVPTKSKSVDFPTVDATLSGVERFPIFKLIVKSASLQSAYSKKIDETGNADTGQLNERSTNTSSIPLLGLNLTFNKGIRGSIRYEKNDRKRENLRQEAGNQRIDYNQDRTFRASVTYSLTAPQGLNIPIFGKVKFDSQLSLSLEYSKKFRKSWFYLGGEKNIDANSIETTIVPKASYRFSAKITGGLNARWVDSNDKVQKRNRHVRELGIWTELRF